MCIRDRDRSFHGQVRFSVPTGPSSSSLSLPAPKSSNVDKTGATTASTTELGPSLTQGRSGIGALFARLEKSKAELGLEFYAVSQATLDQVFLNIVGKHNVEEEDYERAHPKTVGIWGRFIRGVGKVVHNA